MSLGLTLTLMVGSFVASFLTTLAVLVWRGHRDE